MAKFYANKKYYIYAHINKINQKAYIGITVQTKAKYRWGKDGEHYNQQPKFYRAIKKYGWENFDHIVLAENILGKDIAKFEQDYIKKYDSYKNGYNATPGGEHECKYQKRCRPVYQCNLLDNTIINEFHSISDAARWLEENNEQIGAHKSVVRSISEICTNKYPIRKSYFGFNWCFKENYANMPLYQVNSQAKRVLQYDLDGNFIKEWLSVAKAEKALGINNIKLVCYGKRKKAGGYFWKYKE